MSMISELVNELRIRADVEGRGTINEHLMTKAADTIETLSEKAREPKQGEWIFRTIFPNDKSEFPMGYLECSICGSTHANKTPCNFCDNCGARMKGVNDAVDAV